MPRRWGRRGGRRAPRRSGGDGGCARGRCRRCPRVSRRWRSRTRARRPRRNPRGVPPGERMVATHASTTPGGRTRARDGNVPVSGGDAGRRRRQRARLEPPISMRGVEAGRRSDGTCPAAPSVARGRPHEMNELARATQATHDRGSARSGVDRDERVRSWPAWPHAMGARDDSDLERLNRRLRPLGLEVTVDDIGGRGRCLRATRDFARGELALSSAAFASHLLSSHLTARCAGASSGARVCSDARRVAAPRTAPARARGATGSRAIVGSAARSRRSTEPSRAPRLTR